MRVVRPRFCVYLSSISHTRQRCIMPANLMWRAQVIQVGHIRCTVETAGKVVCSLLRRESCIYIKTQGANRSSDATSASVARSASKPPCSSRRKESVDALLPMATPLHVSFCTSALQPTDRTFDIRVVFPKNRQSWEHSALRRLNLVMRSAAVPPLRIETRPLTRPRPAPPQLQPPAVLAHLCLHPAVVKRVDLS